MRDRVKCFEVDHHPINNRFKIEPHTLRRCSIRVDKSGEPVHLVVRLHCGEQFGHKDRLLGGFAARERDARKKRRGSTNLIEHLRHAHMTRLGSGVVWTPTHATIAADTGGGVPQHIASRGEAQRPRLADSNTFATVVAHIDRVRVMARNAVEIAPLEKHHASVTRTIDRGEPHDVANQRSGTHTGAPNSAADADARS